MYICQYGKNQQGDCGNPEGKCHHYEPHEYDDGKGGWFCEGCFCGAIREWDVKCIPIEKVENV